MSPLGILHALSQANADIRNRLGAGMPGLPTLLGGTFGEGEDPSGSLSAAGAIKRPRNWRDVRVRGGYGSGSGATTGGGSGPGDINDPIEGNEQQ